MATTFPRAGEARGRHADTPTDVPAKGWKDVVVRTLKEAKADGVPLLAAGVAFYGLLSLVPAISAAAGIYGLVADPATAGDRAEELLAAAPAEVRDMVTAQLQSAAEAPTGQAGLAAVIGIVLALWSASSGMKHLLEAINRAYDEEETRGFLKLRGMSLLLTVGAVLFVGLTVAVIAAGPALLANTALGDASRIAIGILRFPILAVAMAAALAVLYRYGADRDEPQWRWAAPGSIVATVAWLAGSALFSVYTANFGKYDETYGSLGAIVVVLLWLFLTAYVVVLGAEINAEAERQTAEDTTEGRHRPLGQRDARAADTLGPTADEVKAGTPAGADVRR